MPCDRAWLRGAVRTVLCLLVLCLSAGAITAPAQASTTELQVKALLAKVHQLQGQTVIALQAYKSSLTAVSTSVTTSLDRTQASTQAQAAANQAQTRLGNRVRALYMTGGQAGLVSSMLSGDVAGLGGRLVTVQRVIAGSRSAALQAKQSSAAAHQLAVSSRQRVGASLATAADVQTAVANLSGLLGQQRQLLHQALKAQAAERARALAAQARAERQAAEQAAKQAAAELLAERQAKAAITAGVAQQTVGPVPASAGYLQLYREAAKTCPGLSWSVLAGVGQIESGHGRNIGPSSAGAEGPMQFLPSTFSAYAVDGDHDGVRNILDPADAIFTAALFLCFHGAGTGPTGVHRALLFYNHAKWYVALVLAAAQNYT